MEKYAVTVGGGVNHRMGLYDMVMLKDNHIDFAGGISQAILKTKNYLIANNKELKDATDALVAKQKQQTKEIEENIT